MTVHGRNAHVVIFGHYYLAVRPHANSSIELQHQESAFVIQYIELYYITDRDATHV